MCLRLTNVHVPYWGAHIAVSKVWSSVGTVSEDRSLCTVGNRYFKKSNYYWISERPQEVLSRYSSDESEVNTLTLL